MGGVVDGHEKAQGALQLGEVQVSEAGRPHRSRAKSEKALKPRSTREPFQGSDATESFGQREPNHSNDPHYASEPFTRSEPPYSREPKASSDPRTVREPTTQRASRPINIPHDPSESQLHQSIAELLDWILKPPAFFTTFPAGWGRLSKGTAGRLFASGLKKGMPDILVFDEGPKVIGIELKVGRNSVSSAQRAMFAQLQAVGITVYVCRSQEDVRAALYREFIDCRNIDDGTDKQESLR